MERKHVPKLSGDLAIWSFANQSVGKNVNGNKRTGGSSLPGLGFTVECICSSIYYFS